MNVLPHHTIQELHTLYRTEPDARMARRIQGIRLAARGMTGPEIVEILGVARRTVQVWVAKYNQGGLEALLDRPRSGAPTKLPPAAEQELRRRIEAGPTAADGVSAFTAPVIRQMIHREYGVLYSLSGLYDWLHRQGFAYLVPRPQHEQSDPEAQEAFKKTSPPRWRRSSRTTPTST
jgi:transposase